MSALRVVLFVVAAVAIAATANLVLLGIASGPKDPVGRLTPRAGLVRLPTAPVTTSPAATTTTTTTTTTTVQAPPPTGHAGDGERSSRHADD